MPLEFWVGRLCEEFHCLPSAAIREIESAPVGFLETIVLFRTYQRSYQAFHGGGTVPDELPLKAVVAALTEERLLRES